MWPLVLTLATVSGALQRQVPAESTTLVKPAPAWLREEMTQLASGTGRWLVDNRANMSPDEPWDHYGMEWTWGLGRQTLEGRLFALKDGKEAGSIWEYRIFWHPGEGSAYVQQFAGDGSFGSGTLVSDGKGGVFLDQMIYSPDGPVVRVGHQAHFAQDVRITRSLNWGSGTWAPRREYHWQRVPPVPR